MRFLRSGVAVCLAALLLLDFGGVGKACGPEYIQPIFVFEGSPDLPFEEFTRGQIGIVQPTFGRKTLTIAYRYLNGGSFNSEEQKALVAALHGKAPESGDSSAIKAWVAVRKEFVRENEKLPDIYTERQYSGYDFFPNCTNNAFAVAIETLKDRAASYGAEDRNVRDWLAAQDTVFQNCAGGQTIPPDPGTGSPAWLRQDREYQIAAALFYSLDFEQARARFAAIAADNESPWQATADYLVARTLVRQASLKSNQARQREIYEQAEAYLQGLIGRSGKFHDASRRLLALIKYRLRPEQRVRELAQILANSGSNENLQQDLIDYVWLLDKFETQIFAAEAKRREELKPPEEREQRRDWFYSKEAKERYDSLHTGAMIEIRIYLKQADGSPDYSSGGIGFQFKHDATETEILEAFEVELGRKLTAEEVKEVKERHQSALLQRQYLVSPNRQWESNRYEEHYYGDEKLTLDLVPGFYRSDDLSDWIFSLQTADAKAFGHALSRWQETQSPAWLLSALIKADKASRQVDKLMAAAEKIESDSPAFPTLAYHLVRLKVAFGRQAEARKVLDQIISSQLDLLPVSAQNQFLEQRMQLAESLTEFLKFAARKPVVFYVEGRYGKVRDLLKAATDNWNADYYEQSKEDFERETEARFKDLLPWDSRLALDEETVDVFNWHFPLAALAEAGRNSALPDYLQRRLVLAVWTRAILLKNNDIAQKIAPEVIKVAPEMTPLFMPYLNAHTTAGREHAALYVLLKFPHLSPLVEGGLPTFETSEESDYYLESAWWCTPSDTEYNNEGKQVPKIVRKPGFLTMEQLQAARKERAALVAVGDGKSYLGKQVIAWARTSPEDARIPEALFIAARANAQYKYGCDGWDYDQETKAGAETILTERYPRSPWAGKLAERSR